MTTRSRAPFVLAGALLLLVAGAVLAAGGALGSIVGRPGGAAATGASGLVALLADGVITAVAVAGGAPVALAVLQLADPAVRSPDLLHGGAWVGVLERTAITVSLLAGWPEGIAITLAIKGLGRYPELRAPAAAERFIIGTFASVLWACGCAGVLLTARR